MEISPLNQRTRLRPAALDRLHLAEFEEALTSAEVIEETVVDTDALKELLLAVEWIRPLHVVVVVDER